MHHRVDGPAISWSRREVEALLRVSEAAAFEANLEDVLDVIAGEACHVTRSKAASILLAEPGGVFRLAASKGLSGDYNRFLQSSFISHGHSSSRVAASQLEPVVIDDMTQDRRVNHPEAREWKRFARQEGYSALISVPLIVGRRSSGVLNLYRAESGPWLGAEVELAATFAQHAASAIDSARLIDSQRRQLEALEQLIRVLRNQTHEYANRLHALSGLLALGETREAQSFLAQLMTVHHDNYASVIERVHHPILAGLLVAQMSVARQRGVEVRLHRQTRLESLPERLGSAEAVTIVANLIENAVEAVSGQPAGRRKASVRISQNRDRVAIAVRDWGDGLDTPLEEVSTRGRTSKRDHAGIGLALVSEAVESAHGSIVARRLKNGTVFTVTLPCG
ncbi:MAG TPA: GAF domain-containing protein [Solirubrobacteraceae bacterium]|jgi:GAF domain-containing protein|nr:GAF domain-containing protein [Solirubrobacteraceae bacterium]